MIMKKLKKALPLGVLSFSLFGAQSAFASDGVADTRETAIPISPGFIYHTIADSTDVDWFTWTNNTGVELSNWIATLYSPAGVNYDLDVITISGGYESSVTGQDNGIGQTDGVATSPVYPGDTVFFKVRGHRAADFNPVAAYTLELELTYK